MYTRSRYGQTRFASSSQSIPPEVPGVYVSTSGRYYALSNDLPIIDSLSLPWIIRTLKEFYSDIGTVVIVDCNRNVVRTLTLINNKLVFGETECEREEPYLSIPANISAKNDTWLISTSP